MTAGLRAADAYIAERTEKRARGIDVPPHRFHDGQPGPASFQGVRTVDGQPLALLKADDTATEILVLPIDAATAQRLTRATVGQEVAVTPTGSIRMSVRETELRSGAAGQGAHDSARRVPPDVFSRVSDCAFEDIPAAAVRTWRLIDEIEQPLGKDAVTTYLMHILTPRIAGRTEELRDSPDYTEFVKRLTDGSAAVQRMRDAQEAAEKAKDNDRDE